MNAEEAKKKALENTKRFNEHMEVKKHSAHNADVTLLYNHFLEKIEEAVNKGKLATDGIPFQSDRFPDAVIQEVNGLLRLDGYTLNISKHNAYNTTSFVVSWA